MESVADVKKRASTSVSASLIVGFRRSHYGFPGVDTCDIRRTWIGLKPYSDPMHIS